MLDLSKISFEQKAEYSYSTSYYFIYDNTDPKSVSDRFLSKEHYESKYGKIACITLNLEADIEDVNHPLIFIFRASPTCEIEGYGLSDVDWVDIGVLDADEDTAKELLKIAGEL